MNERFGPWSSSLGDGLSPHLSTFWKRRLTLLASARAARLGLTRRDWLKLGAAGSAACALPTLHLASADGPDDVKPASAGKIYVHAVLNTASANDGPLRGIFAIDPGTSTWNKVCDFGNAARVSRDGRKLALIQYGEGGRVWTLDAEGKGERHQVADFGGVTSWSPDGKLLIVAKWLSKPKDDDSRSENWRFNADGSNATKLPILETEEVDDWSPDGRWLVTVSDRHPPHGRGYQLYLMRPDGTDQRRLTEDGGLNVYPRFSPDSRRIAYLHQERGKNSLWVVNIDGSGRRRVFEEENDASPDHLCWSPDGKWLACKIEDWQRDEKGKKYLGGSKNSKPRIAIMDDEGKKSRTLNLPPAMWLGAPDWH